MSMEKRELMESNQCCVGVKWYREFENYAFVNKCEELLGHRLLLDCGFLCNIRIFNKTQVETKT